MENKVLSIAKMQELIELGIDTSNTSMIWLPVMAIDKATNTPYVDRHDLSIKHSICNAYWRTREGKVTYPTFTLQDILEMLPSYSITYDKYTNCSDKYEIRIDIPEGQHYITHIAQSSESLLEAAFRMLKWCKANSY